MPSSTMPVVKEIACMDPYYAPWQIKG